MKLKRSSLGEFVPVIDNKNIYYGGHQDNLKYRNVSKFYRDRSCVVTAFTNTYLYLYKPLEKFTIDQYNDYQYWFFKIIRPKIYGVVSAKVLDVKINKLRRDYHLNLKAKILRDSLIERKTIETKAKFIEEALERDCPVILFNWASFSVKIMRHHAVTITEIEKKDDDYILTVSSWAKMYKISLKKFSNQLRTYSGLIYFERTDK